MNDLQSIVISFWANDDFVVMHISGYFTTFVFNHFKYSDLCLNIQFFIKFNSLYIRYLVL